MSSADIHADRTVRQSITVPAGVEEAFEIYTAEFDTWWPRGHHIGKSPMKRAVMEGRTGGRCYSEHEDGSECPWGTILEWDPPRRFVMAWQITQTWSYEPDLSKASEVEVRFTAEGDGNTRVDLEHRYFERHGEGGDIMRTAVGRPNGWSALLQAYADRVAAQRSQL